MLMPKNILIEVSAVNPDTKLINVVRMSAAHATAEGIFVDGKVWVPAITGEPEYQVGYWGEGRTQALTVSYGQVDLIVSAELQNKHWGKLDFDGADATIWVGEMGAPFSAYKQRYLGKVGPFVEGDSRTARFSLLGAEAQLTRQLLDRTYAGTGGVEGPSTMLGTLKPISFGECTNVAPVLMDSVRFIYQVNAYAPTPINAVFSSALTLGPPVTNATSYAALAALTLKPGQWATCTSAGMFRLGGDPGNGKITADIGTPMTATAIAGELVKRSGILPARIAPSFTTGTRVSSLYKTENATIGDLVRQYAFEASRLLITDSKGVLHLAPNNSTKAPGKLASDGSARPFVRPDTIVLEAPASPSWKVVIGHTPVWTVHSAAEISPAVYAEGADLLALIAAAKAAKDRADAASAGASLALLRIDDAIKDGILDRIEKRFWLTEFETATAEAQTIVSDGRARALNTEAQALADAFAALDSYLGTLDPALTDLTRDTPINGPTFKARFAAYYGARQDVLNALARIAKTEAGQPTSVAELNPVDGAKLEEAVKDAQNAIIGVDKVRTQLPDLVGPLLLTPIDNLSALHLTGSSATLKASKALSDKNAVAITQLGTRVDETGAVIAEQVTQLTSRIEKGEDTIEAGFLEVNRTIANTKEALAESVVLTIAKYGESASASMVEERRVRASKDQALAEDIEQMAVELTTDFGDKLTGQINDVKQIIADENGIIGTRIEELGVKLVEDVAGEKLAREAAIQTVEKAIIDGDGVTAGRIDTISSSYDALNRYVGDVAGSVEGANGRIDAVYGVIQTTQETSANANEARAQEIRNLQSSLDGMNYAQLQQEFNTYASKVDGIGAEYTLKVQTMQNGERVVAGMGIAIENGVSAISFLTDSFRIATPGTNETKQVFYADGEGIYMPNVRVDKLAANSITINEIAPGLSRSPRYTAGDIMIPGYEITVIETPFFSVGFNNDATGATENGSSLATLSFTHDGSQVVDTAADIRVYVDTGGGYQLLRTSRSGIATKDGNTVWSLKFTDTIAITASGAARVRITAQGVPFGNSPRNSGTYARSPEINIISIGR